MNTKTHGATINKPLLSNRDDLSAFYNALTQFVSTKGLLHGEVTCQRVQVVAVSL